MAICQPLALTKFQFNRRQKALAEGLSSSALLSTTEASPSRPMSLLPKPVSTPCRTVSPSSMVPAVLLPTLSHRVLLHRLRSVNFRRLLIVKIQSTHYCPGSGTPAAIRCLGSVHQGSTPRPLRSRPRHCGCHCVSVLRHWQLCHRPNPCW
jgi:hypothetical protein